MEPTPFIPASHEGRRQLILRTARFELGPAAASSFMDVRNFALGGRTPSELIHSEEGVRQILNEIDAHAGGGPL